MARPKSTAKELLSTVSLFSELDPNDVEDLQRVSRRRSVAMDAVVVRQGEADGDLYGVVQGLLRVSVRASDGRDFALQLLGPGQAFGEIALVDGLPRSATVTALKPSDLVVVLRTELLALLQRSPALSLKLLGAMAAHVRRLTSRSEELSALPVSVRMARRLLEIADLCGTPLTTNRVALPIDLSQQDLADHVQATRESVNKCLARWMKQGIVHRTNSQIVIADRGRLAALSSGGA